MSSNKKSNITALTTVKERMLSTAKYGDLQSINSGEHSGMQVMIKVLAKLQLNDPWKKDTNRLDFLSSFFYFRLVRLLTLSL